VKPAARDIEIYQGDTFDLYFRLKQKNTETNFFEYVDLTGAVGKAHLRTEAKADALMAEAQVTVSDQAVTPGGVWVHLSPVQTATVVAGVWDCQLTFADGTVRTVLGGKVKVIVGVTR
jgi:hypothetical protein